MNTVYFMMLLMFGTGLGLFMLMIVIIAVAEVTTRPKQTDHEETVGERLIGIVPQVNVSQKVPRKIHRRVDHIRKESKRQAMKSATGTLAQIEAIFQENKR